MLGVDPQARVFLAAGVTDMRKQIDGLALLVAEVLKADPFSAHLFCFANRQRDKVKILQWTGTGFWVYYKRLERGRFHWPEPGDGSTRVTLSRRELEWLLEGLPLGRCRDEAHRREHYQRVA
ncbi:IS66 family insertion sequence element accessory protein TnpB [Halorhodospira halochloris]|uniref:IS66 family insertion sequence element accessory protein TnpB n=1 Tax=Halorhodospira halochloris TaxID=1052 RepID=UPI001EE8B8DB|nr:IS66 family insertion sequence element accessory protein TnpB [Halorhodospira halochloris]MCG5548925.1 IS66 family insertion sequence element accessory protein TnpB [Halorhodospira halochloris]